MGAALRRIRTLARRELEDVADALGVSRGTVSGWENGYRIPSMDQLAELARVYDIPLDTLLDELGYPMPTPSLSFRAWYRARISRQSLADGRPDSPAENRATPADSAIGGHLSSPYVDLELSHAC